MAHFVYIDESGTLGAYTLRNRYLILAAAIVPETQVQPLAVSVRDLLARHLGYYALGRELHAAEIWGGSKEWARMSYGERLDALADALSLLSKHNVQIAHATIDKKLLHTRYDGEADKNAYLLALQFLLEKIDRNVEPTLKVVVADESSENHLRAIHLVRELQQWSIGLVPGTQLQTIIDSIHFVRSHDSPGVQVADLVAFLLGHRRRRPREGHADSEKAIQMFLACIAEHTTTWRTVWPWR